MKKDFLWWRDGIIYQIYPRSFMDANNDGIGDLNGITSKLDYLMDLGVDALWLSPIYPSPDVDFGYDVADYINIDPKFGTMQDFDHLLKEARRRNIRIILDLVLNHTSDQHPWFLESKKSKDNPYHDWYLWRDAKPNGKMPNNWLSVFGGKGWAYDEQLNQYYFHMFYKQQPDVNWRNPATRKALLDVFRFWLDRGVNGFRLDVFNVYFKHAQMPDNRWKPYGIQPFQWMAHQHDINQPEMYPLVEEIRAILDGYPETYVVGETFESTHQKAASYCSENALHAAFNFDLLHSRWDAQGFMEIIQSWDDDLAGRAFPNYVLNNHDVRRSASRYCRDENDARLKVAIALLLTLRGTPYLYYGEEIGMRDIPVKRQDILDPIGKRYYPFFKGRDGCRAPMQWDGSTYAGFSRAKPWLPVHENHHQRNVDRHTADAESLLNFYKALIAIRRNHPALQHGSFKNLPTQSRQVVSYTRVEDDEEMLIVLNFSEASQQHQLPEGQWQQIPLMGQQKALELGRALQLQPHQVLICKKG